MKPDDNNTVNNTAPAVSPELKADHTWYNSLFTQLLAPLVATRYMWLAIEDINPGNFLKKPDPTKRSNFKPFEKPKGFAYMSRNFAALGMGATFLGIVGMYSKNTLNDIKSIYAEAVGYELGKKTEDVTLGDIFLKSRNEALEITRSAYVWRTLARVATAATFFIPWHKFSDFSAKPVKPKYDANANVGVGAIGAYLYTEGFLREPSFFDIEQKMVSSKIKHNDVNPYATIQPQDVQALLTLQRKHRNKNYQPPSGASADGQNDIKLATHIADLLNQTYHNVPSTEEVHFTIGKLNFLIGFGLLEKFPESMAFIELANKSSDMSEVKQAASAIRAGQNPQEVFAQFGVDTQSLATKEPATLQTVHPTKFADAVKPTQEKAFAPKSHMDYAAQTNSQHLAV